MERMDDLISRQAAIDALKKAYWDKDLQAAKDDPCVIDAMTDWAIRQIKALPSAQLGTNLAEVGTDCISRQAAINALSTITVYKGSIPYNTAVMRINHLPPAQPEIIYCKDCKHYGRADKRRFYRGYDCLDGRIASIVPDKDFCSRAERREVTE